jgi:hypothetical protein
LAHGDRNSLKKFHGNEADSFLGFFPSLTAHFEYIEEKMDRGCGDRDNWCAKMISPSLICVSLSSIGCAWQNLPSSYE